MNNFISKYHTYLVAAVAAATVLFQVLTGTEVPNFVYEIEAAIGLGSVRVGMTQVGSTTGWKTYALAGALAVTAGLRAYGIDLPLQVDGFIVSLAGASIASAAQKIT